MKIAKIAAAAAVTVGIATASLPAHAQDVELGLLECVVEGGAGFIFGSSKDLSCEFTPADDSLPKEAYFGVINKYGIDVGVTGTTIIAWVVFAAADDFAYERGALSGDYVGASAEASVAAGGGVNVMIGSSDDAISLQPVSVQAQEGVNAAVGIAELQLRSSAD